MRYPQHLRRIIGHSLRQRYKQLLRLVRLFRKSDTSKQFEYFCLALLFLTFFLRCALPTISTVSVNDSIAPSVHDTFPNPPKLPPSQTREELLRFEADLAKVSVCARKRIHDNVEHLQLCGDFALTRERKKIVGLVELRNVETSVHSFLSALEHTVDSVVVIDDHSTDATRNEILRYNSASVGKAGVHNGLVEVLLNKSGNWVREELLDRELLLTAARGVGATHFVLLDYDEYLSANCEQNGYLRQHILALNPGESLYLPWVELWKSPSLHRVLQHDSRMNFLTRRQIVIFADDGKFQYTAEASIARRLGTSSEHHESTIHVLRCPRTLCPQPEKYKDRTSQFAYPPRVKTVENCAIVETRFLSLNNVLLKSAWYEALGRIMGANDNITRGKMLDQMFPRHDFSAEQDSSSTADEVALAVSDPTWLQHGSLRSDQYAQVEIWRARELFQWIQDRSLGFFDGLEVMKLIDFSALRTAVQLAEQHQTPLVHVPRVKTAAFVMIIESPSNTAIDSVLRAIGWEQISTDDLMMSFSHGVKLSEPWSENANKYEIFKAEMDRLLTEALKKSASRLVFASCTQGTLDLKLSVLELLRNEFSFVHVTALFVTIGVRGLMMESMLSRKALEYASEAGSHMRVLSIPRQNLGSFMVLYWLRARLLGGLRDQSKQFSVEENSLLLNFAESLHRSAKGVKLLPVAKLVFSLNVGRSGSKYVSDILGSVSDPISAHHEPACESGLCSGGGAIRMQERSLQASYGERQRVKLPMIRRSIADIPEYGLSGNAFRTKTISCTRMRYYLNTSGYSTTETGYGLPIVEVSSRSGCGVHLIRDAVYAETNPNFKSWFYDVVLDDMPRSGYKVTVIVIRKYIAAALRSLYETGYFTSRDGYNWMETASSVNSHLRIAGLQDDSKLGAHDKLLSYLFNAEATFEHITNKYGKTQCDGVQKGSVEFIETRAEHVYSRNGTLELLRQLGLQPSRETYDVIGVVADKYGTWGSKRRLRRTSLEACERKLEEFLKRFGVEQWKSAGFEEVLRPVKGFNYPE